MALHQDVSDKTITQTGIPRLGSGFGSRCVQHSPPLSNPLRLALDPPNIIDNNIRFLEYPANRYADPGDGCDIGVRTATMAIFLVFRIFAVITNQITEC